jgi:hypothetical protein
VSTGAKTRAQALRAVAEDPDLNSAEFNRAFVLMQYLGYLRRNPNDKRALVSAPRSVASTIFAKPGYCLLIAL